MKHPIKRLLASILLCIQFFTMTACGLIHDLSSSGSEPNNGDKNHSSGELSASDETPPAPGERGNPIPVGETAIYYGIENAHLNTYDVKLTVKGVLRSSDAWTLIEQENQLNPAPAEDKEYILVKFHIEAIASKDHQPIGINSFDFDFYSEDGVKYDAVMIVPPDPAFAEIDLTENPETEGFAYCLIDTGDTPVIVFQEITNDGLWFCTETE